MAKIYKKELVEWLKGLGLNTEKVEIELKNENELISDKKALEIINKYYTPETAMMFIIAISK